jgi:LAO/AO transport system kinase
MAELRFAAHLHYASPASPKDVDWEVPVLAAQAAAGVGLPELLAAIRRHRATLTDSGALEKRRQARRRQELDAVLAEELTAQVMARVRSDESLARTLDAVTAGALDPYSAATRILAATLRPS